MNKVIVNIIILLLPIYVFGQDTCIMKIHTAGIVIGETEMVNHKSTPGKQHYHILSNTRFFAIYHVEYKLEAWYTNHQLDSSYAYYKVNKHFKHYCIINKHDTSYIVTLNYSKPDTIPIPPLDSYCQLFFHKNYPPEQIYSEYDGATKLINYINDSTFQIVAKNDHVEATYFIVDSMIQGGYINHALLKFNILKE